MQEHEQAITGEHGPDIRIERAAWRDLRAVAAIQKASFRPGLAYGLSGLTVLRVFPGVVFLVARTADESVVGCIISDRDHGNTRIMNLAVDPAFRRQGVGRALLRTIEEQLPDGNVVLMAEEWNTGAQALYASEGYSHDGLVRDYYAVGKHGVRMKKVRRNGGSSVIRV